MDALSYSLCFDTTSLAHRDAVRGERHPPHLDLDGLAALDSALAGYDGAVLAVSHDQAFLRALAPGRVIHLGG